WTSCPRRSCQRARNRESALPQAVPPAGGQIRRHRATVAGNSQTDSAWTTIEPHRYERSEADGASKEETNETHESVESTLINSDSCGKRFSLRPLRDAVPVLSRHFEGLNWLSQTSGWTHGDR